MRQRIIYIALFLLALLVFPLSVKTAHALSHHHERSHFLDHCRDSLSPNIGHCSICDFEYTGFVFAHEVVLPRSALQFGELVLPFTDIITSSFKGSQTPLRGPPCYLF